MSTTYYHYQGFVYGPCDEIKPNRGDYSADTRHIYMMRQREWKSRVLSLLKYKWTGPPLEDWQPLIEGKDFMLGRTNSSEIKPGPTIAYAINQ